MRLRTVAALTLLVLVALPAFALQRVVLYEQFTNSG
jgi:hypothetical protein